MFIKEGSGMFTHLSLVPYLSSPKSYSTVKNSREVQYCYWILVFEFCSK